jgi:hypothetical protein
MPPCRSASHAGASLRWATSNGGAFYVSKLMPRLVMSAKTGIEASAHHIRCRSPKFPFPRERRNTSSSMRRLVSFGGHPALSNDGLRPHPHMARLTPEADQQRDCHRDNGGDAGQRPGVVTA